MAVASIAPPKQKPARQLKWSVPRWSTARDLKRVAPILFGIRPIVRISIASLILGTALFIGAKLAFPQLQANFVGKGLLTIPGMFAYLGIYFLARLVIPAQFKITERYASYFTGQTGWHIELSDIESSKLVVYSSEHIRLFIRGKGRIREVSLPVTTDLRLLTSLLVDTIVLDKRCEFRAAQELVEAGRLTGHAGRREVTSA